MCSSAQNVASYLNLRIVRTLGNVGLAKRYSRMMGPPSEIVADVPPVER
jgi:hypothetical protein